MEAREALQARQAGKQLLRLSPPPPPRWAPEDAVCPLLPGQPCKMRCTRDGVW